MKKFLILLVILVLAGCQTNSFTNIGLSEQITSYRYMDLKVISTDRSFIKVYKINEDMFALISPLYNTSTIRQSINFNDFNYCVTIDEKVKNELLAALQEIITIYSTEMPLNRATIIDFMVFETNNSVTKTQVLTPSTSPTVSISSINQSNKNIFRIQLKSTKDSSPFSKDDKKTIRLYIDDYSADMNLQEVKQLIDDLN